jgi:hypothetical protein
MLQVTGFGRFSLRIESAAGSALQWVDRMAGPGPKHGQIGEKDGRIDLLFDRGEYKIRTFGHPKATGEARVVVHGFVEKNVPEPPRLVELRPVGAELGDLEQISYWLEIPHRRRVILEAAGRYLEDLRLWRQGSWLVDAAPEVSIIEPRPGQPMKLCRLSPVLEAGLYLLSAYGGPGQTWADETDDQPFHLRYSWPELPQAGRQLRQVSPFGIDHFLLPPGVDYLRLELPEARPAELRNQEYDPKQPFSWHGQRAEIDKDSALPVAELNPSGTGWRQVSVRGEAGQSYILQHFQRVSGNVLKGKGEYWVSTLSSGDARDNLDATAILVRSRRRGDGRRMYQLMNASLVAIGPQQSWSRRANLTAPMTLHLRIEATGQYELSSEGVVAEHRIEPLLLSRPKGYEAPPWRQSGALWDLQSGVYVLTLQPKEKGIVRISLRPKGWQEKLLGSLGLDRREAASPARAACRFPAVDLQPGDAIRLQANRRPGVVTGLVLRPLPLNLSDALPLTQLPGEVVELPFKATRQGHLVALADDGSRLEIQVDDGVWSQQPPVIVGSHVARIRHGGDSTVAYSLSLAEDSLSLDPPLPPLPEGRVAALPSLPVLNHREARFMDLRREQEVTFLVKATDSALYRLESTGLLDTVGNLRTRVVTSLQRSTGQGSGRNFLIQSYLRAGDYQVSISPRGKSQGRVGVLLSRLPVRDGGRLLDGIAARGLLPAGEAVAYRFQIEKAGRYHLRSLGLGRTFRIRLEDGAGWPITKPELPGDLKIDLQAGDYRLIVLPSPLAARQLTLFSRLPEKSERQGHGPFPLPLGETVAHRWLEPAAGEAREMDRWRFTLPAPAHVRIWASDEMQADLLALGDSPSGERLEQGKPGRKVAYVAPRRGWSGELPAGSYELAFSCIRSNNRFDYDLRLQVVELLAGGGREVDLPALVDLSVGTAGLVQLSSFGTSDVRAHLEHPSGRLIAEADDRPGDWNFLLSERLAAGRYRLRVESVTGAGGKTFLSMELPSEHLEEALATSDSRELLLGRGVHLIPLQPARDGQILVLGAASAESFSLTLEEREGGAWRALQQRQGYSLNLILPLAEVERPDYRLRLRSLEHRGNPVRISTQAALPKEVSEAQLARGVTIQPLRGVQPPLALVALAAEGPGCLRLSAVGAEEGFYQASQLGQPGEAVAGTVPLLAPTLWLAAASPDGKGVQIKGERERLRSAAKPLRLRVPAGRKVGCDLDQAGLATDWILLRASTVAGQPGVAAGDAGLGMAAELNQASEIDTMDSLDSDLHRHFAVAGSRAVSLGRVASGASAWAWGGSGGALDMQLTVEGLPAFAAEKAAWGRWQGVLEPGEARSFRLPLAEKSLRMITDSGLVIALRQGDSIESLHWNGEEPLDETVLTQAGELLLYSPLEQPSASRFSFEMFRLEREAEARAAGVIPDAASEGLRPGRPYEQRTSRSGSRRLLLIGGIPGSMVRVRGAQEVLLLGADGSVSIGPDLALPAGGGALRIKHGPGLVLAWVEAAGSFGKGPWTVDQASSPTTFETPARIELGEPTRTFDLDLAEPSLLRLRYPAASISRLQIVGEEARIQVHAESTHIDAYLPAGKVRLTLRAPGSLSGASLRGMAEIELLKVSPIGEGLGPEILLGSGDSQAFSFVLAQPGPVGLGVAAPADRIETSLLDSTGRVLGRGAIQMHTLDAGTYVLLLRLPPTDPPLRARPAVVGLEPPDTGPPEAVLRSYLQLAQVAGPGGPGGPEEIDCELEANTEGGEACLH